MTTPQDWTHTQHCLVTNSLRPDRIKDTKAQGTPQERRQTRLQWVASYPSSIRAAQTGLRGLWKRTQVEKDWMDLAWTGGRKGKWLWLKYTVCLYEILKELIKVLFTRPSWYPNSSCSPLWVTSLRFLSEGHLKAQLLAALNKQTNNEPKISKLTLSFQLEFPKVFSMYVTLKGESPSLKSWGHLVCGKEGKAQARGEKIAVTQT